MKNESKRIIDKKNDDFMNGSYLGPRYSSSEIETALNSLHASYKKLNEKQIIDYAANEISKGKIIGWMQGRCEFGPRALGNRSILADPRNLNMQRSLNLKIKYRESFRPFAPSILEDKMKEWFEFEDKSPYMLFVADVKSEKN